MQMPLTSRSSSPTCTRPEQSRSGCKYGDRAARPGPSKVHLKGQPRELSAPPQPAAASNQFPGGAEEIRAPRLKPSVRLREIGRSGTAVRQAENATSAAPGSRSLQPFLNSSALCSSGATNGAAPPHQSHAPRLLFSPATFLILSRAPPSHISKLSLRSSCLHRALCVNISCSLSVQHGTYISECHGPGDQDTRLGWWGVGLGGLGLLTTPVSSPAPHDPGDDNSSCGLISPDGRPLPRTGVITQRSMEIILPSPCTRKSISACRIYIRPYSLAPWPCHVVSFKLSPWCLSVFLN